jgi:hypothetical protein
MDVPEAARKERRHRGRSMRTHSIDMAGGLGGARSLIAHLAMLALPRCTRIATSLPLATNYHMPGSIPALALLRRVSIAYAGMRS